MRTLWRTSMVVVATGLAAVLLGCSSASTAQEGDPAAGGAPTAEAGAGARVEVTLGDLFIEPDTVSAPAGQPITFAVHNEGGIPHDLTLEGVDATSLLSRGDEAELRVEALEAGTYTLFCSVPGHADAGMRVTLEVGAAAAHAGHGGAGTTPMTNDEVDAAHLASMRAFPADTAGRGGQLAAFEVVDGVKVFDLTADEVEWEVAPGDVRPALAFNGQVPGPEIRVQLGDRVRIVLHNHLDESTSIHFHGLQVPNDQDGVPGLTQDPIKPGEDYTYEFTVRNAGTHMYHPHIHGAHQLPLGMLGAFIVEAPDDPAVDLDRVVVLNDGPLGYTINGKGFPATEEITVKQGQRLRLRYMNEGMQSHPMHLHGLVQTVIARDGYPLASPYQADTVLVAPGERLDVLVEATELGGWMFHCHILSHTEDDQGMFGMVTVLTVEAP